MITIEEINKFSDALKLKPDWDRIVEEGNLDIFQSFDFVMSLWETWGDKKDITLLIARDETKVLGIFPLAYNKAHIFGFLPVNTISLLTGLIFMPNDFIIKDRISESLDALLYYLSTTHFKYDVFEITGYYSGVRNDSRVSHWLMNSKHKKIIKRKIPSALYIKLVDNWEGYLKNKSRDFRRQIQKFDNYLGKKEIFEVKCFSSSDGMEFVLDKIYEIQRESWRADRDGGVLIEFDAVLKKFHSIYLKKAAAMGNILAMFLCINNEYAAFTLNIVNGKKTSSIATSYKEKFKEYSPGFILHKYLVKKLFELGIKEHELGVYSWPREGHMEWQKRWATGSKENYWIWLYNNKHWYVLCEYYLRRLSGFVKNRMRFQEVK